MSHKDLAKSISELLRDREKTLALAETCTGGMIADVLTDQPGASAFFMGSVVAYSYPSLSELLKVKPQTLEKHGAVSEATVLEMAQSVRQLFSADIGLAICGITGPSGGTPHKPIGTTCLTISDGTKSTTHHACFKGDRRANKKQMATFALEALKDFLKTSHPNA